MKIRYFLFFILFIPVLIYSCISSRKAVPHHNNLIHIPKGEKNIQRYLDAIQGPSTVQFEEGTYIINEPLIIKEKTHFHIMGKGNTVLKVQSGRPKKNGGILIIRDCANFSISNLTLDANVENRKSENNQIPSHNLRLLGVNNFVVDNIEFPSCIQDGIVVQQTDNFPHNGLITNCNIQQYWRSGISIINGMDIRIKDCKFNKAQNNATGGGINVEENNFNKRPNKRISIEGCVFSNQQYGIQFSSKGLGSGDCSVANCIFTNGQRGVYNSFRNTKLDNCIFDSNSCDKAQHNIIRNQQHTKSDNVTMELANCIFTNNHASTISYSDGNVDAQKFIACKFDNNEGYLISFYGKELEIVDNEFIGSGRGGISSFHKNSNILLRDNTFTEIDSRVLYIKNGNSVTLLDNMFSTKNTYVNEIAKVIHIEKYSISGNKVYKSQTAKKTSTDFIINGTNLTDYE